MDADKTVFAGQKSFDQGDMAFFLVGIDGPMAGERIEISSEPCVIGRRQDAVVTIRDPTVSGHHCRVVVLMGQLMIEDMGSSNGTFVSEERISSPQVVTAGTMVQIGDSIFKVEHRSRKEIEEEARLAGDLEKAAGYVQSLLPAILKEGPVTTDWRFVPSDKLGGDAFGYHWLDEDHFVIYLVDVSGHGTAPALHSVSVMNLLSKQSLPDVDFKDPAAVLAALNTQFQMSAHASMYFTFWYGVYNKTSRQLTYASGGHPPALLTSRDGEPQQLITPNMAIGWLPGVPYQSATVDVAPGSRLFVYSDGAYELVLEDGEEWRVGAFLELLSYAPEDDEPKWVEQQVRGVMKDDVFDDDFSVLVARFW